VEQELLILPEYLSSLPIFSGVRVARIILNPTLSFDKHLYEASKFYHLRKTFLILGMLIENKYNEKHKEFEDNKGVIRNFNI
jgi:hypothetical protein